MPVNMRLSAQRCFEGQLASAAKASTTKKCAKPSKTWSRFRKDAPSGNVGVSPQSAFAGNRCKQQTEEVVAAFLRKDWDDRLITAFGTIAVRPTEAILLAESWLKSAPQMRRYCSRSGVLLSS